MNPTIYLLNGVPTYNASGSSSIIIGTGLFADGTLAAPSIAFLNQTSLGFYRPSAGTVGCTGNLTVSGSLTAATNFTLSSVSGYNFLGFNNAQNLTTATGIYSGTGDNTLYLNAPTGSTVRARVNGVDMLTVSNATVTTPNLTVYDAGNTFAATFRGTGAANTMVAIGTVTGGAAINAYTPTFSATAPLCLQPNGGNLLVGGTGDAGNGNLQLKDTSGTAAGGIGFGTDVSLYRPAAGFLQLDGATFGGLKIKDVAAGAANYIVSDGGSLYVGVTDTPSAANDALIIDSSKNATFAKKVGFTAQAAGSTLVDLSSTDDAQILGFGGNTYLKMGGNFTLNAGNEGFISVLGNALIRVSASYVKTFQPLWLNNAYTASAMVATGYVTIKDSTGTTYKVLVST